MRALLQRVTRASVSIAGQHVAHTALGLAVFVSIARDDTEDDARYLVDKLVNLRVFPGADGRFDRSALDMKAELLLISQFTLHADTRKGRRPSFIDAAPPEVAEPLFNRFIELARATGLPIQTGRFQEHMLVEIHNDGPLTILVDSAGRHRPRSGAPKEP